MCTGGIPFSKLSGASSGEQNGSLTTGELCIFISASCSERSGSNPRGNSLECSRSDPSSPAGGGMATEDRSHGMEGSASLERLESHSNTYYQPRVLLSNSSFNAVKRTLISICAGGGGGSVGIQQRVDPVGGSLSEVSEQHSGVSPHQAQRAHFLHLHLRLRLIAWRQETRRRAQQLEIDEQVWATNPPPWKWIRRQGEEGRRLVFIPSDREMAPPSERARDSSVSLSWREREMEKE
ncbi:hypothetical protein EYF80_000500 [Liparis tanakae]|uniref:Uncharacterized protein n=1 Tax=Liparis tanakae TaxID=230148 RepID=A0A4Z2JIZ3_9TELE|nr:hypothetical protein EYF80_000500 [Liparis tanakae]